MGKKSEENGKSCHFQLGKIISLYKEIAIIRIVVQQNIRNAMWDRVTSERGNPWQPHLHSRKRPK